MAVTISATCKKAPCFGSELVKTQHELFQDDLFTDLEIKVDGGSISCHRVVAASQSSVIKAMLTSGMKEAQTNSVSFPSITKPVITLIIQFMYTGQVQLDSQEILLKTLAACDYLNFSSFRTHLLNHIFSSLTADNVFNMLEFATEYNFPLLVDACRRVLYLAFEDVVKHEDFHAIGEEDVLEYLSKCNNYDIPADTVLQAFITWLEHNPTHCDVNVDFIDLRQCSSSVLRECLKICEDKIPAAKNLLRALKTACAVEKKEMENILLYIHYDAILTTKDKEDKFYKVLEASSRHDEITYKATLPEGILLDIDRRLNVFEAATMNLKELSPYRNQADTIFNDYLDVVSHRSGLAFCNDSKIVYWDNIYNPKDLDGPSFPYTESGESFYGLVNVRGELFAVSHEYRTLYAVKDKELIRKSPIPDCASICKVFGVFDWILVIASIEDPVKSRGIVYWYSPQLDAWSQMPVILPQFPSEDYYSSCIYVADRKLYYQSSGYLHEACLATMRSKSGTKKLPVPDYLAVEMEIVSMRVCKDLYEEKRGNLVTESEEGDP